MDILDKIAQAVVDMDKESVKKYILKAIADDSTSVTDIYQNGLNKGMSEVLKLYDEKVYFLPEVVVCADALNEGISILREHGNIDKSGAIKVTMAVVEGDTHEIGKNIVKIMMEASGFDVVDLGVNQKSEDIVNHALDNNSDIIALSSMMTSTMKNMKNVIDDLNQKDHSNKPKVIIGGAPVSENFAKKIGADGYSENAPKAVELVRSVINSK